jgi:gluconolactonase
MQKAVTRRTLLKTLGAAAGAAVATRDRASGQTQAQPPPGTPPSTISNPPRDFGPNASPNTYADPDFVTVDPRFNSLVLGNTPIKRLWTGALWCEGPAWSAQGRFFVWSDIPNDRILRWLEDDGRVTVYRSPSNNTNGNTFDFQGRQLSCQHLARRVVRFEHNGTETVIAESYNGKKLNSPNDVVPHPDGSYWFTDPPYGRSWYEGRPEKRELPTGVYRVDPNGGMTLVVTEEQLPDPNGLAFSPDYKKLYICSTGRGPGDTGPGGKGDVHAFDVGADNKLSNQKRFSDFMINGVKCGPDGVRCDVEGNLWISSNAGRNIGYSGVTVWTPDGTLLGRIRLPEVCANVCFGGPKRNRLFMAASQSIYAVYVGTQGAAPG